MTDNDLAGFVELDVDRERAGRGTWHCTQRATKPVVASGSSTQRRSPSLSV